MAKIKWDEIGKRIYETGVRNCVLYVRKPDGDYESGVAWNGLVSVTESPDGADPTDIFADDIKYLTLRSQENFKASIEAYTYPEEFLPCEGVIYPLPGVLLGQQPYRAFALCYRSTVGNDVYNESYGYKLHIIYNALSSPSEKSYQTVNDQPEATQFSWDITSIPILVEGNRPTATLTIDSTKVAGSDLAIIEDGLYGTDKEEPKLLMPEEIATIFNVGLLYDDETDYIIIGEDRICV